MVKSGGEQAVRFRLKRSLQGTRSDKKMRSGCDVNMDRI